MNEYSDHAIIQDESPNHHVPSLKNNMANRWRRFIVRHMEKCQTNFPIPHAKHELPAFPTKSKGSSALPFPDEGAASGAKPNHNPPTFLLSLLHSTTDITATPPTYIYCSRYTQHYYLSCRSDITHTPLSPRPIACLAFTK